jgi:hypothetical protein
MMVLITPGFAHSKLLLIYTLPDIAGENRKNGKPCCNGYNDHGPGRFDLCLIQMISHEKIYQFR